MIAVKIKRVYLYKFSLSIDNMRIKFLTFLARAEYIIMFYNGSYESLRIINKILGKTATAKIR